ncbi:DUF3795 domain-containing protein [candidate division KSB1 bacterium]|nr:DUF3795 domain-containing protein [candidate division KSB1 bacterium]
MSHSNEAKNLVGCCGLYCGLCSKYQSNAPSRCIGCRLGEQHSWCSIWNCCVKKHQYETCSDCRHLFHCAIFVRRKVAEWIPAAENLRQINKVGLASWTREQEKRQALLERLLEEYNEGRSMSLFCKVCARMPIDLINRAREETAAALAREKDKSDLKAKARLFKTVIKDIAAAANIDLN